MASYLYYDAEGTLREFITGEARNGDDANTVYAYFASLTPTGVAAFVRHNVIAGGTTIDQEIITADKVTGEVPYNQYRTLKFFQYYTAYSFYKLSLSAAKQQTTEGLCTITYTLTFSDGSTLATEVYNLYFEANSVALDESMTYSNFYYLSTIVSSSYAVTIAPAVIGGTQGYYATSYKDGRPLQVYSALRDGNGSIISDTYMPVAGGTMTGSLTVNGDVTANNGIFTQATVGSLKSGSLLFALPASAGTLATEEWSAAQYVPLAQKGTANGVASLDENGKVLVSELPDSVLGNVMCGGVFVPSTGIATVTAAFKSKFGITTPTITLNSSSYSLYESVFFIASADGIFDSMEFSIGDWLFSTGTAWMKIDNVDAVKSINGKSGAVTLYGTDIAISDVSAETVSAALSDKVDISSTQTVTGSKTFTKQVTAGAGVAVGSTAYLNGSITNGANTFSYPSVSGTLALEGEIPTNVVTTDTAQTITGSKEFTSDVSVSQTTELGTETGTLSATGADIRAISSGVTAYTTYKQGIIDNGGSTLTLPSKSGTVALTSDITPSSDLTSPVTISNTAETGKVVTITNNDISYTTGGATFTYAFPASSGTLATTAQLVPLGTVYGTGTGNLAVGDGSVAGTSGKNYTNMTAYGVNATASGNFSTANGYGSVASGIASTAIGETSRASGYGSTAIGEDSVANEFGTIAIGYASTASGFASTAIGQISKASGYGAVALGKASLSSASGAVSIGSFVVGNDFYSSNNYIPNTVTFDGLGTGTVHPNMTIHMGYPSNIFFRNADNNSTNTTLAAYTSGKTLQQLLDEKVGTSTANTFTATQTISNDAMIGEDLKLTNTGVTVSSIADKATTTYGMNSIVYTEDADTYTITLPSKTDTLAVLGANTFTDAQTIQSSADDLKLTLDPAGGLLITDLASAKNTLYGQGHISNNSQTYVLPKEGVSGGDNIPAGASFIEYGTGAVPNGATTAEQGFKMTHTAPPTIVFAFYTGPALDVRVYSSDYGTASFTVTKSGTMSGDTPYKWLAIWA